MTPTEVLAQYEPRVRVIAWEWENPYAPREDLAQEGRVALWQASEKRPGDDMKHLASVVIRRAVSNGAVDQRWTGTHYTRGKMKDPIRREPELIDLETSVGARDLLEGVEIAYHHGEIAQAINALPPAHREYVVLRFWGGMSHGEIAAHQGRTKGNAHRTWTDSIIPKLRTSLAHLEGAA